MKKRITLLFVLFILPLIFLTGCDLVALTKNPFVMIIIGAIVLWFAFNMNKKD